MSAPDAEVVPLYRKTTLDTVLAVALAYRVFPCRPRDETVGGAAFHPAKSPLIAGGFKRAASEPALLTEWWGRWPEALIGVPTGTRAGIVVVDIDPRGLTWYEANRDRLPATRTHRTPRGLHLLFTTILLCDGVGSNTNKIADGVDVRGDGGYIIWWPAHGYAVENDGTLAELPDWLVDEIVPKPANDIHPLLEKQPTPHTIEEARAILLRLDPDMSYDDWVKVGMAVHHQFGSDGFAVWNAWSSTGKKYRGLGDLGAHWRTFHAHEDAVTFRTLLDMAKQQPADSPPIPILSADAFLARPRPKWRIKNLLPETGVALVFGASGSGKTFFTLDLVAAVIGGVCWGRGQLIVKQGRVVYVAAEGPGGFRNRVEALKQQDRNLAGLSVIPATPLITSDNDADKLIETIHTVGGADVVVLDTLSAVTTGVDENSSEISVAIREAARIQQEFNCLVVFIGHTGKNRDLGHRGWSGIIAAVDTAIEVTQSGSLRTAKVTKQRDGDSDAEYSFMLRPVTIGIDEDGDPITTCVVDHCATPEAVPTIRQPAGTRQRAVYDVIMSGTTQFAEVVTAAASRLPQDRGKDRRREYVRRAIEQLIGNEVLVRDGDALSIS